jgi:ketosteroid isomerase-like protein
MIADDVASSGFPSPADLVIRYCEAWARRDKSAALALAADDIVFRMVLPEDILPFGGVTAGKPSISDRLQTILDAFDTIRYRLTIKRADEATVSGRVHFCFRHKLTGEDIDGVMRIDIRVRDGLITDWTEYHDVERIRAFMRLVSYKASI